jgi:hypothetical protein
MADIRRIVKLIVDLLYSNVPDVRPSRKDSRWILYTHPETDAEFPIISFTQVSSSISEIGIGAVSDIVKQKVSSEYLSGDGVKTVFQLNKYPIYKIEYIEYPIGNRLKWIDEYYEEDFSKGLVGFRTPPDVGVNNIKVSYSYNTDASIQTGFRNRLSYQISVWVKRGEIYKVNDSEYGLYNENMSGGKLCDYLAEKVIDAVMKNREFLRTQGVIYSKISGFSQSSYDESTQLYVKLITLELELDSMYNEEEYTIKDIEEVFV